MVSIESEWRQGFGEDIVRAMVNFGFTNLGVRKIFAEVISDNEGCRRLLEKVGFVEDPNLATIETFKGRSWDVLTYYLVPLRLF